MTKHLFEIRKHTPDVHKKCSLTSDGHVCSPVALCQRLMRPEISIELSNIIRSDGSGVFSSPHPISSPCWSSPPPDPRGCVSLRAECGNTASTQCVCVCVCEWERVLTHTQRAVKACLSATEADRFEPHRVQHKVEPSGRRAPPAGWTESQAKLSFSQSFRY